MAPTREETVDALYATLDRDGLVSPAAFDRHGAVQSFGQHSLRIDGTIEVGPAERTSGADPPESCDVCAAVQLAAPDGDATPDPVAAATDYVLAEGPFLETGPSDGVADVYVRSDHEPVTCEYCEGRGEFDCSGCDGAGRESCSLCDGSGRRRSRRLWRTDCEWCGATGWVPCSECDGSGALQCDACSGAGSRHAYDAARVRTETEWHVDGLPEEWVADRAPHRTVASLGLPESAFYMSVTGSTAATAAEPTSIRVSAPDLAAGLLEVTYGDVRYRGALLEWEGGSTFVYDPGTGPIETSPGRKLRDVWSRLSRRGELRGSKRRAGRRSE